jgi:hypothetical protein
MLAWLDRPKNFMVFVAAIVALGVLLGIVAPQGGLALGKILDPNNLHVPCPCRN